MSSLNPFAKKDEGSKSVVEGKPPATTKKEVEEIQDMNPDNKPPADVTESDGKAHVCQMKRGDYMIHIFVEQAKNLKVEAEQTVDPIVQINCLNERRFTTAQDDINNTGIAIWNEHIFFEPKNLETSDLENAKVQIKLMDKGFFKDALIGYYEFDLSFLYQQPDHSLMHKWIIMSNPESETFGEVTGQLKVSIVITGEGDEQVQITDDPNPEIEDIIQPPQIKPKFYQLRFQFFTGQKIVPMDKVVMGKNKTDAYIRCDYKTTRLKSKVVICEEGGECTWNQEFLVPAQVPIIGGRIVFKIYDEDVVSDEIIGSIFVDIKDIIPSVEDQTPGRFMNKFDWKNIYGAPLGVSGKMTDAMNKNPEIASLWKGRILMRATCEETEKPLLLVKKIQQEDIDLAKPCLLNRSYAASIFIAGGIGLPYDNTDFEVGVRIADKEWMSGLPKVKKAKYNRYNALPTENEREFRLPYLNIQDIGTVFIYLYKGKKRICYWKGSIMDFTNPNPAIQWIELLPDFAIGEVKDHYKAGIVGIRMSIHDVSLNGQIDWKDFPQWAKKISKRPPNIKIRIFCWQARDLPAADESGSSDPFIQITDSDRTQNTAVIWDNVNPLFYQGIDAIYEANSIEELPPVIVDLYDKDKSTIGSDGEDFLSRALLFVQNLDYSNGDTIPKPEWHPLYFRKGGPPCGEVLLSFAIVADDYNFKKSLDKLKMEKEVEMKEFGVSMNILGLRGLQSPGLLPIKKAFLQFNLKSLVPPALGTSLQNIRTEPRMAGSDPTLNTLIEFMAPLPVEILFCPRMSCSVFDNIVMGLSQPLIGTFVIPIGDLMHSLIKERKEETQALEDVVAAVKKLVSGEAMVASFRTMIKNKQQALQAEQDLLKVQQENDKLLQEEQMRMSINAGSVDNGNLLTGDHDEETRQSQRVREAARASVEGPRNVIEQALIIQLQEANKAAKAGPQIEAERTPSMILQQRGLSVMSNGEVRVENKFDPKLKQQLMAIETEKVYQRKRDAEEARKKAKAEFTSVENLIMPEYIHDDIMDCDRETNVPPADLFIGLGWDENKDSNRKHYRRYYPDELERVKKIMPRETPFNQFDLKRGQTRGASVGFWAKITNSYKTDQSGQVNSEKMVGRFKAVIEVEGKEERKAYFKRKHELIDELVAGLKQLAKNRKIENFNLDLEALDTMEGRQAMKNSMEPLAVNHLHIVKKLADIESDIILKRMLLKTAKMVVRVYMIEGFELASRDIGGYSDPYLILKMGQKVFNERKNYILDEPNPKFCKHYDFETTLPGCPMLFIDAMDYDDLFGDDLIGSTSVDLEDRYFLPEWQALKNIPVEYRQLYHPSSAVSQGQLKMWIEINPVQVAPEKQVRKWDITPKPPLDLQMRVCIFDTKEIKMMDAEGTSDVYIRAFFDSKKDPLETDTHYRCQTGNASFNYRLNFKTQFPRQHYNFTVQAYDRDFFKSNDIIGSAYINLKQAFEDVELTKRPLRVDKKYHDEYIRKEGDISLEWDKDGESFWMPMMQKSNEGVMENNGYVRVRIDITTMEWAEKNKIGSAREDPNTEPYLPPPVGRLHFTLNPCEMYKQLIGAAMRRKIAIWCCITISSVLCVMLLYYLVPIVIGNLIASKL